MLGDPDLYRLTDRTQPGQPGERLGLFHQTLTDYLTVRGPAGQDLGRVVHGALADAIAELAPAGRHTPGGYRDDPLLGYAFAAGPRHLHLAGRTADVAADLEARPDPVPAVNLSRHAAWATIVQDSLGPDHPATLTARNNIAHWTGETGEPAQALRLSQELLPDLVRVLGPDHPATLTTRSNVAAWTGETGDPALALRLFRELLPDRVRVLGADHPATLDTRGNIASWTGANR